MKTTLASAFVLALLSTINHQLSTARAQGSLTPPGAPAPTMKSLDQIEARTPISSAPFTISNPGSYYLTTNVNVTTGNAIIIAADNVTLNLNGFTISSTAPSATGTAILLNSSLHDITIANGHIRGGVTDSGGVYSGLGFAYGIYYGLFPPVNVLVSHVTVSACLNHGIYLNIADSSTVVESCVVRTVGSFGIYASTIKQSSATDCGGNAIYGDEVSNCHGQSSGTGDGVYASGSAEACYGNSSSGSGIYSVGSAHNCYGNSSGNYGVSAAAAQNCYGSSSSYIGVGATTAQNCYGNSSTGDGLYCAANAQNCYGSSGNSIGLNAEVAENCEGVSNSGTGLSAYIGNASYGISTSGTAEIVTLKYNMP